MEEVIIRQASEKDIPNIQEIAFSTWPSAYAAILSKEQLHYMLDLFYAAESLKGQMKDRHEFYMAETGLHTIGFASISQLNEDTYKLQKLYVLPAAQKTGAGKALIEFVIERVRNYGAKAIQLNVNRHNKAIRFYEKRGFVIIKEDNINIGNEYYMNDYVMEMKFS